MFFKIAIFSVLALMVAEANLVPIVPVVIEPYARQPYSFGYDIKDKLSNQYRQEVSDGVAVKGSYGFADARGIQRQVNYIADKLGFRADIKTNEPGTANQNPADVRLISNAPLSRIAPIVGSVAGPILG